MMLLVIVIWYHKIFLYQTMRMMIAEMMIMMIKVMTDQVIIKKNLTIVALLRI